MLKAIVVSGMMSVGCSLAFGQVGGKNAFEFVDLPNNAHVAGIGAVNVSLLDQSPGLMFQNPALLNPKMNNFLEMNYLPYFADIQGGAFSYANKFKDYGTYGLGFQFTNYGKIESMDESGNNLGSFMPIDYYFYAGGSHQIGLYTLGASLKFAGSKIENYGASALMADIGGIFKHPEKDFTIGLTIKNAGFALKKYIKGSDVNMPFDIQVGTSFKPAHMPLRLSITAHHLHRFDIVYLDPTVKGPVDLEGNEIKPKKTFADKLGRHFVLGGEFIVSKNFNVRVGYNYLRRRELRLQTKSGGAGFSFGFMMRIKSFELAFSRAFYHVAGGANYLTITTDFNRLFTKNKKSKGTEENGNY